MSPYSPVRRNNPNAPKTTFMNSDSLRQSMGRQEKSPKRVVKPDRTVVLNKINKFFELYDNNVLALGEKLALYYSKMTLRDASLKEAYEELSSQVQLYALLLT